MKQVVLTRNLFLLHLGFLFFMSILASGCDRQHKDMALIPAGEFTMGSDAKDAKDDEKPPHRVFVDAFWMDKYEVSNYHYGKFLKETGYENRPEHWEDGKYNSGPNYPDSPVVSVTYADAESYCAWLGKRLPTEQEWEKACRGGKDTAFPWGDTVTPLDANYNSQGSMPVYSFKPNGYGLYNMAGNVREYTSSWYKAYPGNQVPDEKYGEQYKVNRGGSWYSQDPASIRCANRTEATIDSRFADRGFRCAMDAKKK